MNAKVSCRHGGAKDAKAFLLTFWDSSLLHFDSEIWVRLSTFFGTCFALFGEILDIHVLSFHQVLCFFNFVFKKHVFSSNFWFGVNLPYEHS